MTWWSWILIWIALFLGSIGMLAAFGWSLFRKGMRILRETEDLTEKMARLAEVADAEPVQRQPSALLVPLEQVQRRRDERRLLREEYTHSRREARVRRGKLLVHRNPIVK